MRFFFFDFRQRHLLSRALSWFFSVSSGKNPRCSLKSGHVHFPHCYLTFRPYRTCHSWVIECVVKLLTDKKVLTVSALGQGFSIFFFFDWLTTKWNLTISMSLQIFFFNWNYTLTVEMRCDVGGSDARQQMYVWLTFFHCLKLLSFLRSDFQLRPPTSK